MFSAYMHEVNLKVV